MADTTVLNSLDDAMVEAATLVDRELDRAIPAPEGKTGRLFEAMRYASFAGGKRLRPFLVMAGARLFGADDRHAARVAAAVEMIHTYSLIHDDLPAMDDDDMRRGKPSTHKAFDEATAILAGDALLTLAFEVLADPATHPDAAVRGALALGLARAAGGKGMVGGQVLDLAAEHTSPGLEDIVLIERLKTGALIAFSCAAGPIVAGAGEAARNNLTEFGQDLGLAFQIVDDLLDVVGEESQVGKKLGKDAAAGKATFVAALGTEKAQAKAEALVESAISRLSDYGPQAEPLRQVARFVLSRTA